MKASSFDLFSRPLHGLGIGFVPTPSDESLGYFQQSAGRSIYSSVKADH